MLFGVGAPCFLGMGTRVAAMTARRVSMMRGLLMLAAIVVPCRLSVMPRRVGVMF
jgi:hypothetical protein